MTFVPESDVHPMIDASIVAGRVVSKVENWSGYPETRFACRCVHIDRSGGLLRLCDYHRGMNDGAWLTDPTRQQLAAALADTLAVTGQTGWHIETAVGSDSDTWEAELSVQTSGYTGDTCTWGFSTGEGPTASLATAAAIAAIGSTLEGGAN